MPLYPNHDLILHSPQQIPIPLAQSLLIDKSIDQLSHHLSVVLELLAVELEDVFERVEVGLHRKLLHQQRLLGLDAEGLEVEQRRDLAVREVVVEAQHESQGVVEVEFLGDLERSVDQLVDLGEELWGQCVVEVVDEPFGGFYAVGLDYALRADF